MLDPAVSAAIKKYGLMKWALMDFPHLVFGFTSGLIGSAVLFWAAFKETKKNSIAPYVSNYLVVRPDDPRLKYIKVWAENETSEINK